MRTAIEAAREIEPDGEESEEVSKGLTEIDTKGRSPIVRLVNSLLIKAIRMNASDIHVEPFEDEMRVRYRIDGALVKVLGVKSSAKHEIVSRIKVMAMMDIAERRIPQDGRLPGPVGRWNRRGLPAQYPSECPRGKGGSPDPGSG